MTGDGRGALSAYLGGAAGAASALRIACRDQPLRRDASRIDQPSRPQRNLMNSTSTILNTTFLLLPSGRPSEREPHRRYRRGWGGQLFGYRNTLRWSTFRVSNTTPDNRCQSPTISANPR